MEAREWHVDDEVELQRLGERLGACLAPGDAVLLEGPMGAGKTTFAAGVGAGAGVMQPMTSPTYVLRQEHRGRFRVAHYDLYRLYADPERPETLDLESVWALGLDDDLAGGAILLIEWPGPLAEEMEAYLRIILRPEGRARTVRAEAFGKRPESILKEWTAS
ncbi:tRNA (adenosine(37)-N6)-threonylcarbamoyltransferase complex ATPase subunit type 1 TsaE [Alicyclobacillus mali]|uniref:tRNA threonylcarbamoyladenosine biosynthesis protein TsaE n=1 Tax=Alicyclobacillus mali (ex Roth et al. 2021) TaxID=1123961 RepID=A0ABS0F4B3_9BACL|nr:tRNA (adenosine(37)-N6)-threonylcarbamoyltransferase complex ATPase subunit type 1 TsaE [Alicyclobacillus mali (ex Roth et al. 2021)]MBF8378133.1 tRNA (adenosine(37)-N6)-threonylcarbamoyltransferase complex ATPase subunit type 1 TsaE [Alicyclobacillus mali (ex Roth et al. 2021)]